MGSERALKESTTRESERSLFSRYWGKAKITVRKEGLRSLFIKTGRQLKKVCFDTNAAVWFFKNLTIQISAEQNEGVKFELAEKCEFDQWLQAHSEQFPWIYVEQEVLATANDPRFCFVVKANNDIVAFLKVAVKSAYVLDYDEHLSLSTDMAFVQDTFVLPQFRRKEIAKFLLSHAMIFLSNRGYNWIFCHIPEWNIASRRLYKSLGFKRLAHVYFVRLFKWKFYTTNPEELINSVKCV